MTFVEWLWLIASLLAAASLAIMTGLIVVRALRERRDRRLDARRRLLEDCLSEPVHLAAGSSRRQASDFTIRFFANRLELAADPAERTKILAHAEKLGLPERLRRDLRVRVPRYRCAAATLLAEYPGEETVAALNVALGDRHRDVRLAAALSLARMERAPPARELVERLGIGTRERSGLVMVLFDEIARAHPEQIVELVRDPDLAPDARAAAIEAMSASGDRRFVTLLVALVDAAEPGARELPRYLEKLGEIGDPYAGPAVMQWLGRTDPTACAAAAQAAGRLRLAHAAPKLGALLGNEDWWVRFRASEALAELGVNGQQVLAEAAAHGRGAARDSAAIALAERGLAR